MIFLRFIQRTEHNIPTAKGVSFGYNCIMKWEKLSVRTVAEVLAVSLIPALVLIIPFALNLSHVWEIPLRESGMRQIYANWDGPNYILNAITLYDPLEIAKRAFLQRPNEYYAAHFPLYSLLIRSIAPLFGYFLSGLVVQLISGSILNLAFYAWIHPHSKHPLWLTLAFTIFPPRYWVLRTVVAPELLIVACVIIALHAWHRERPVLSGIAALCAVLLKFQAVIFTPVLLVALIERYIRKEKVRVGHWISVFMPLVGYSLVALLYQLRFHDAGAYFTAQEIVNMGMSLPLGMFNYARHWVATGWLEAPALYLVGIAMLIVALSRNYPRIYFWFALGYAGMLSLIPQIDIMRLAVPLSPLFFLAFRTLLEHRTFRIGLIVSIPALYLYTMNFIMTNQAPIADWGLFK